MFIFFNSIAVFINTLNILLTRQSFNNRKLCVAGPLAWDSPSLHIRSAPTLSTFKTMLFSHVPTSTTNNCFQSTSSEHCTTPL